MSVFPLPDLGEGLQEAEIVAWHVAEGDHVVADQPLVSIETGKAVVEVPSPRSGHIARLAGAPGDVIAVGAVLVEFEDTAEPDHGTVVGELEQAERAEAAPRPRPAPAAEGGGVKAAPAVRALAGQLGVDLQSVRPSGPQGSITRADVEAAATQAPGAPERDEPLRGVRRTMAQAMARSRARVVPATVTDEADVDLWPQGTDVSVRLVRAVAAGCTAEPALNAWLDSAAMTRRLHREVHLGLAVDTAEGLFVPVLRNVAGKSAEELRRDLEAAKQAVRSRRTALEAFQGATFTLSNFGMLGGRFATLVIVPPQVAILGAGRIAAQVVPEDGGAAVRRRLPLSLTFDHRAVTGGEAARFLASVIADLEAPQ